MDKQYLFPLYVRQSDGSFRFVCYCQTLTRAEELRDMIQIDGNISIGERELWQRVV